MITLSCIQVAAQSTPKVNNITGIAFIEGSTSPNEAKAQALNDAKLNALKAAGIAEYIQNYQLLLSSQQQNDFTQFFSSAVQSEMQGAVKEYEIVSERVYCKNENQIICEVIINATVIKYETKPDPSFDANIEGIKAAYNNSENLTFTVKTTQDCYLTIFNITDKEATILYPNIYEKQQQLLGEKTYTYPQAKINYTLSTSARQEINRLIFVFTKIPMVFIKVNTQQTTTTDAIFSWIYSMPPDQRNVEYQQLIVVK